MEFEELTMILGRPLTEFEWKINDFGGTKRSNNIPSVLPNSFGPPTVVAVVADF